LIEALKSFGFYVTKRHSSFYCAQAFTSNGYNIYTSSLANTHEFGTTFQVDSKINHMVKNFTPINEHLCVIRIKGKFFNYSLVNIHAPTCMTQMTAGTDSIVAELLKNGDTNLVDALHAVIQQAWTSETLLH
jgi:hypothetical protein